MRLYLAPDSDLHAFAVAPSALKAWLHYPRSRADVSLHEYWRDLEAMLATTPGAAGKMLLSANGADWIFPDVGDRGAYGISSTTTQALLRAVEQVDRPRVEAYVSERWEGQTAATGQSPDLTELQVSSSTGELLLYLGRLRDACILGVAKGYGIVMALWEEP